MSNEVLLYSTGNRIQSPGMDHEGEENIRKGGIYGYDWVTLLYSQNGHNIGNQL